jgi:glycosyltransferase involved in cell wall biosynthesis
VCHVNLRTPYAAQYGLLAALLAPSTRVVAVEHLPLESASPLRRWFKRRTSRYLDAHVAVGEETARAVEREVGLSPGTIRVIRNGVPRQPDNLPVERLAPSPVLGAVGRLEAQKGFDILVDALTWLPEATAVVVGEGVDRPALEQRAAVRGVGARFVLAGPRASAAAAIRGFDVFVLPSRYEGLPLVVLEAMEAGVPIVATDVGSVREVVIDGETGLLVPPDDAQALAAALLRLLRDADLRSRLAQRARSVWASCFDARRMAEEYERLYREVLL